MVQSTSAMATKYNEWIRLGLAFYDANDFQVSAIFLQWPHQGAKNLTNKKSNSLLAVSNVCYDSLNTFPSSSYLGYYTFASSWFSYFFSSLSYFLVSCYPAGTLSFIHYTIAYLVLALLYLVGSAAPLLKKFTVGYPLTPYFWHSGLWMVQSTSASRAGEPSSLRASAASRYGSAKFLQCPHLHYKPCITREHRIWLEYPGIHLTPHRNPFLPTLRRFFKFHS